MLWRNEKGRGGIASPALIRKDFEPYDQALPDKLDSAVCPFSCVAASTMPDRNMKLRATVM